MKIAIAGASGFVGKNLVKELEKNHEIIGLSRAKKADTNHIQWRDCDLFSMLDAEKGLAGCDVAIYLVHSMRPSAHLTQGTFDDFDLIVADNFVRAAEACGIKQIIFLGGMRPEDKSQESKHLRSRWEVEQVFRKSKVPSTILRAALILGPEGSSFHIMARLVERLPFMICPTWTYSHSHPIALSDAVAAIDYCVGREETFDQVYEIGTEQSVTYVELMKKIAAKLHLKRSILTIPFVTPKLSTLWVCMVTGAPRELVRPLIQGLRTSLPLRPEKLLRIPGHQYKTVDQALDEALGNYQIKTRPLAFQPSPRGRHVVRSVQRMEAPKGITAEQAALAYLVYLPKANPGLLKVEVTGRWIYFCWRWPYTRLLVLEYSPERSKSDRQLFYVRGGLLSKKTVRGRLEFREILGGDAIIAAIHDFQPRMPWYLYRWTQALFHLYVMKMFGAFLNKNGEVQYQRPPNLEKERHP
ncbi:hypothetical protein AZI86_04945 [Bdellovibrio bacteriovorus]|uniref:NAD(P)-binding domain-containing protein n=1 Tax=Bdellovibrio bacteriovorus TaxID=959 RepID=A0A150WPH0_BDEBC|nr:NAD(P)H-binding protein [Bdellovibrio bacteriovorus]KYG66401.1 hypothetical protein AZI86_04945 [Bdellovibrio bacteriovorus]